ncbi:MAG: hypothetical protein ACFCGT_00815 [Sandaracinaceae bacterium]
MVLASPRPRPGGWPGARAAALLVAVGGCTEEPAPEPPPFEDQELAAQVYESDPGAELDEVPAVPERPVRPRAAEEEAALRREPARRSDPAYAGDTPVAARRYVYRVGLRLPQVVGERQDPVAAPAAELVIDATPARLRARLVGRGWPVHPGAEIRVREEPIGTYVFDGAGGRPLPPGRLASWFEGQDGPVSTPRIYIATLAPRRRHASGPDPSGRLVCALLAEWAGEPRAPFARRCAHGAPPRFRLGAWHAEQTALLPLELPRRALRADDGDPPPPLQDRAAGLLLDREALARLRPGRPAEGPGGALRVRSRASTRVILALQAVPVAWVDPGAQIALPGLAPGRHELGAVRPLGGVVLPGTPVEVPGTVVLGQRGLEAP